MRRRVAQLFFALRLGRRLGKLLFEIRPVSCGGLLRASKAAGSFHRYLSGVAKSFFQPRVP